LQQGFSLEHRPALVGPEPAPLTLALSLAGEGQPQVNVDGRNLRMGGLRYGGLLA
jgi:hypothetical protein